MFLVTNGGPHPVDKWASITQQQITALIDIAPSAAPGATLAKMEFGVAVTKILMKHFQKAQYDERVDHHTKHHAKLGEVCDVSALVDAPVQEVIAATKGTIFEAHFAKPEVQDVVRATIGKDMATILHDERDWHSNGHHISRRTGKCEPLRGYDPNDPNVKAWRAAKDAPPAA